VIIFTPVYNAKIMYIFTMATKRAIFTMATKRAIFTMSTKRAIFTTHSILPFYIFMMKRYKL